MEKSIIADSKPVHVKLEENKTYFWCACGRSSGQPFCDGSHRGTGLTPKKFLVKKDEYATLCMCKKTKNAPYCDGTHRSLGKEEETTQKEQPRPPEASPTLEEPALTGETGSTLLKWNDIHIITGQPYRRPLRKNDQVCTKLVLGPRARKPVEVKIPLIVPDMSFSTLSQDLKIALTRGAELAGTGICSGDMAMFPEEQSEHGPYFYELVSAKFNFSEDLLTKVQAFHFSGGQAANTGLTGHLPRGKVKGKIAKTHNRPIGEGTISPSMLLDLKSPENFKYMADRVREISGGIPIGLKLSSQHIERDLEFAIAASADYIILDGDDGGGVTAPLICRDNILMPTIPALARARHYLNSVGQDNITLVITGGLRTPADFVKALCLGADGIALSNSAMQTIGRMSARICHTKNGTAGVATQDPASQNIINIDKVSKKLENFFKNSTQLMKVLARACGHNKLSQFSLNDITSWKKEMAKPSGISYAGIDHLRKY